MKEIFDARTKHVYVQIMIFIATPIIFGSLAFVATAMMGNLDAGWSGLFAVVIIGIFSLFPDLPYVTNSIAYTAILMYVSGLCAFVVFTVFVFFRTLSRGFRRGTSS